MLKVEEIIRSSKLYDVQRALADLGIPTFSSYEVKLSGILKGILDGETRQVTLSQNQKLRSYAMTANMIR